MNTIELAMLKGILPVGKAKTLDNEWEDIEVTIDTNAALNDNVATINKELDDDSIYLAKMTIDYTAKDHVVGNIPTIYTILTTKELHLTNYIRVSPQDSINIRVVAPSSIRFTSRKYNGDFANVGYINITDCKIKKII